MGKQVSEDVVYMAAGKIAPWPDPLGGCYVLGEWSVPVGVENLGRALTLTATQTKPKDSRFNSTCNCQESLPVHLVI